MDFRCSEQRCLTVLYLALMQQILNFGPSEQTAEQRKIIVEEALRALEATYKKPSLELLVMHDKYIAKEVDLYAVSQLVYKESLQEYREFINEAKKYS